MRACLKGLRFEGTERRRTVIAYILYQLEKHTVVSMKKKDERSQKNMSSPENIQSTNDENMIPLSKHKQVCKRLLLLFIVVIIITVVFSSTYLIISNTFSTNEIVDDYFSMMYDTVYYPETKDDIDEIILTASSISDPYQRLDVIGQWVCKDFIDFVQLSIDSDPYHVQRIGSYHYDTEGRVRAISDEFCGDPYWIAYHRFGGCGELGYLFAYIARESGFETRIVRAEYEECLNNHVWLEIKINDEWMYVDPTMYWCSEYYQTSYEWIMPVNEWAVWDNILLGIWDDETGEEVSQHYPLSRQAVWWEKVWRIPIRNYLGLL